MNFKWNLKQIEAKALSQPTHLIEIYKLQALLAIGERLEKLATPSIDVNTGGIFIIVNAKDGTIEGTFQEISKMISEKDEREYKHINELMKDSQVTK